MLGLIVLSSHDMEHAVDVEIAVLFRSGLSSDLDVMQRHTHTTDE